MPSASVTRLIKEFGNIRCMAPFKPKGIRTTTRPCNKALASLGLANEVSLTCSRCEARHTILDVLVANINGDLHEAEIKAHQIVKMALVDRLHQVALELNPGIDECSGFSSTPP